MAKKKSTSRKHSAKRPKRKTRASGTASARSKKRKTASQSAGKPAAKAVKKNTAKGKVRTKKAAAKSGGGKTSAKKSAARSAPVTKSSATATNTKPPKASGASRARTATDAAQLTPPPPKTPKTRLNNKQLNGFKELLLAKRGELLRDVRMLTKDALGKSRKDSAGDLSSMPIHMADIGSDNWEQDFTLGLIANERQLVREIDEALQRIEERTYGICLVMHKPITVARLRAKPWAKYCIEHARQRETRGL